MRIRTAWDWQSFSAFFFFFFFSARHYCYCCCCWMIAFDFGHDVACCDQRLSMGWRVYVACILYNWSLNSKIRSNSNGRMFEAVAIRSLANVESSRSGWRRVTTINVLSYGSLLYNQLYVVSWDKARKQNWNPNDILCPLHSQYEIEHFIFRTI